MGAPRPVLTMGYDPFLQEARERQLSIRDYDMFPPTKAELSHKTIQDEYRKQLEKPKPQYEDYKVVKAHNEQITSGWEGWKP